MQRVPFPDERNAKAQRRQKRSSSRRAIIGDGKAAGPGQPTSQSANATVSPDPPYRNLSKAATWRICASVRVGSNDGIVPVIAFP